MIAFDAAISLTLGLSEGSSVNPTRKCGTCKWWSRTTEDNGDCVYPIPILPASVSLTKTSTKADQGEDCDTYYAGWCVDNLHLCHEPKTEIVSPSLQDCAGDGHYSCFTCARWIDTNNEYC